VPGPVPASPANNGYKAGFTAALMRSRKGWPPFDRERGVTIMVSMASPRT
jgi:hypothetical protein